MGVKGLWQLLECVGRPVTLESLENKVLGVDASLILNQSVKGMRDKHGNPVRNAHLVGLFNRVCKLLYYRVKPVFVFDGGVPHLKKKTLEARKERRFKAIHGSNRAAEKIVKNYLKAKALETVTGRKSTTTMRSKSPREPDVFDLSPLQSTSTAGDRNSSDEEDIPILDQFRSQQLEEMYQDPGAINIESEDFKALPAEIQHELIKDIKEERKWMNKSDMPRQASDFSSFQLVGVLKRGKVNQRLDELRKDMNSKNSGDLAGVAPDDSLGENCTVKSQKILSEDSAHYILIKNSGQAADKDQKESGTISNDFSGEGGFFHEGQDCEIVSWTNPRPKLAAPIKAPSFDIPELFSSDSEMLSPLLDVPEAGLSPTSPEARRSAFSFYPVKEKKSSVSMLVNVGDNVEDTNEAKKSGELGNKVDDGNGNSEDFKRHELEQRTLAIEKNENDSLIAQIMNKKKELDDLIKKWEVSKTQKTDIDLTSSKHDGSNNVDDKELPCPSLEALADVKDSEEEQEVNIEETENSESAVVIEDQKVAQGNTMDIVCVSEGDSEGSSVEEITASFKPNDGVPTGVESGGGSLVDLDSSDVIRGSQHNAIEDNQGEPVKLTDNHSIKTAVKGDNEFRPVSPDVVMETTPSDDGVIETDQEDLQLSQDGGKMPVLEIQDSPEESMIGMAVDEQEAGPSGLPVEWQGATVEGLEEIQMSIETEQKTLETEQARQSRIAASVSSEMFTECQELLQLFGVPYLVSPMEAEAQCAALDVLGLTEGSITDDSDVFLFGGTRVYKNIFNQQKHAELYASDSVQRNLALDRSNLICIAFITGSDYTEGIQGVGPVGAIELLHEFSGEGLEGLKKFKMWHDEAQEQRKVPQETKVKRKMRTVVLPSDFPSEEVYEAYLHPVVDESSEQFEWGKPDLHSLRLFALDKLGWSSARTDELLLPVLKQLNRDETQLKISQFFKVKFQETRNIKSKRIRRVLNRKFNPSSESDNENGDESNGKKKKSSGNVPSKAVKHKHGRNKKRSHSTEINSKETEETESNVIRPKRAKGENTESGARSSAVNRAKGSFRGRGRGRPKLRKNNGDVHSKSSLELSVEITPLELSYPEKIFQVSQEIPRESSRRGRGQHAIPQPSTAADNKTEGSTANMSVNREKTGNEQAGSSYRARKDTNAQDTSDSTDSDDGNDDNVYIGPKPVSVFRRGRCRGKGNERGRGEERRGLPEKETPAAENAYVGPKPVSVFRRGRGREKGNRRGRGEERRSRPEKETPAADSTDDEDNEENVYVGPKNVSVFRRGRSRDNEDSDFAGPQPVSVSHRGKARGRGVGSGKGRGRVR